MTYIYRVLDNGIFSYSYNNQMNWYGEYQGQNAYYYGQQGGYNNGQQGGYNNEQQSGYNEQQGDYYEQNGQQAGYYGQQGQYYGQEDGEGSDVPFEQWAMMNTEKGEIAKTIYTVAAWIAVVATFLWLFGSIILGFFTPCGRVFCCRSSLHSNSKSMPGIFIGFTLMFANMLLVCSILFAEMDNGSDSDFYEYFNEDEDQDSRMYRTSRKKILKKASNAIAILSLFLSVIYGGYGLSCFFFKDILNEEINSESNGDYEGKVMATEDMCRQISSNSTQLGMHGRKVNERNSGQMSRQNSNRSDLARQNITQDQISSGIRDDILSPTDGADGLLSYNPDLSRSVSPIVPRQVLTTAMISDIDYEEKPNLGQVV